MADFAFSVLGKLASSAYEEISLAWGLKKEIEKLQVTMSTIKAVLQDAEEKQTNDATLRIWLTKLKNVFLNARELLDEIEREVLESQEGKVNGRFGQKLCRFFSSSNPLVFRFRIGHIIKKMRERIDEITTEKRKEKILFARKERSNLRNKPYSYLDEDPDLKKIRKRVLEIVAEIDKLNLNVTYSFFDDDRAMQIVYVVGCIVAVCMDPFFLYIPFLSHTKMCLGINTNLWKVTVALRTVADYFTAQILFNMSIKSILLMCVKYLALAPIPQILFYEKFILKTLRGYTFWNLSLFCHYGTRLVLIFQSCEQLKTTVSVRTLVWFNALVYLFLYFIVSHVIGASWYYLSIKRQLSCWNYDCKIITGCIFLCDDTTPSALNSTHVNEFCPINPPNAAVFNYGIYLDALQSGIVEDKGVLKKFLQCFFWGLRNLSSFASNLHTSTNDGEIVFAIIICALGLILLIYMVENTRVGVPGESRSANSVTGEFDSSSRTEEGGASVQRV